MSLSEHFSFEEGSVSSTAVRLGINNTPPEALIDNMKVAAEGMERVRKALGNVPIHVDSWFRCEALERIIAAKDFLRWCRVHNHPAADPNSWKLYFSTKGHPKGFAVDFISPSFGTPLDIVKALVKTKIKFDQIIQEQDWVHISFAPAMRGEVLTARFHNGEPHYTPGI